MSEIILTGLKTHIKNQNLFKVIEQRQVWRAGNNRNQKICEEFGSQLFQEGPNVLWFLCRFGRRAGIKIEFSGELLLGETGGNLVFICLSARARFQDMRQKSNLQQVAFKINLLLALSLSLNTSRFLGNIEFFFFFFFFQCTNMPRLGN